MADITRVRAEASIVKERLNEEFRQKIARLTSAQIDDIIMMLERTGVNPQQVSALKAEIQRSTNKNATIARVLETPGVLCEQLKSVIGKIVR